MQSNKSKTRTKQRSRVLAWFSVVAVRSAPNLSAADGLLPAMHLIGAKTRLGAGSAGPTLATRQFVIRWL
jgi:hypothetical protein